jgi:predicted secreted protein
MNDLPSQIDLTVGDVHTIELPGLGTAGYMWRETVNGPSGIVELSWSRGFTPGTEPRAVGVSAPEVATITALSPGEVTLQLDQVRPWEKDTAALNQHVIAIRVAQATRSGS